MKGPIVATLAAVIAASCLSPHGARIRGAHAREFGCQERWVQVSDEGQGRWRAIGCGFQSEWQCDSRECRMRDHRSYGMDSP